jgi:hypothetical protein
MRHVAVFGSPEAGHGLRTHGHGLTWPT